jgi:hypothetical protein
MGGRWGMASNGLHFIVLLAYFTGCYEIEMDTSGLLSSSIQSRRDGFFEMLGTLCCSMGIHKLQMTSCNDDSVHVIQIDFADMSFTINEKENLVNLRNLSSGDESLVDFGKVIIWQSELTNIVANDILDRGQCDLPTFEEMEQLHRPFIACLAQFFSGDALVSDGACLIT